MRTFRISKTVHPTVFKLLKDIRPQEHRVVFQSNVTCYEKLDAFIAKLNLDMDPNKYANLTVCLNEAVSNALIHGNRYQLNKKIFLCVKMYEDFVICTIEDEGRGFEFPKFSISKEICPIYNWGERGIYIMKCLSDSFIYSKKGKMVSLIFYYY